jgi:acyl carrier protein
MDKVKSLTEDKLIEFVSWELDKPADEIFPSSNLASDLNLDEQDKMLLIAELENRMDVYLTPDEAEKAETIQDLEQFFHAHVG